MRSELSTASLRPDLPPFPELLNSHLSRRSFNEGGTLNDQLRSSAGANRTGTSNVIVRSARKIEIRILRMAGLQSDFTALLIALSMSAALKTLLTFSSHSGRLLIRFFKRVTEAL